MTPFGTMPVWRRRRLQPDAACVSVYPCDDVVTRAVAIAARPVDPHPEWVLLPVDARRELVEHGTPAAVAHFTRAVRDLGGAG